ncbi:MAG: Hpt domain-containing protein [Lachnospiraceae bacterium]|nr:Hpt domain-containing protein [Lachnospiraceae bacterium]
MTIQECYTLMHGDYEDAIGRLMNDDRIVKYLNKFAAGDDYAALLAALEEKRYEDAFRHSHNLKGMCLNLGITALATSGSTLCEALRGGAPTVDIEPMLEAVKQDYEATIAAISQL